MRNPLAYQKTQTQDGQTSPPDSFCSNDLHQRICFRLSVFVEIIRNYLWHGGSHNWKWGTHGSKLLFQDPNPMRTPLLTIHFNLAVVTCSMTNICLPSTSTIWPLAYQSCIPLGSSFSCEEILYYNLPWCGSYTDTLSSLFHKVEISAISYCFNLLGYSDLW